MELPDGISSKNLTFPLILPFFTINMVLCVKNFLMVSLIRFIGELQQKADLHRAQNPFPYLIYHGMVKAGGQFGFQSANAVIFLP